MFNSVEDPNNVAWFLMGDFLRLSRWSRGLGRQAQAEALIDKPTEVYGQCPREKFLARFVAHCESCVQDVENAIL